MLSGCSPHAWKTSSCLCRQHGILKVRTSPSCHGLRRPVCSRRVQLLQQWARRAEPQEAEKLDKELFKPPPGKGPPKDAKKEGKGLAIVTGAISIFIGVIYLAGVTFMNSRGSQLLPPPPEAYEQDF